MYWRTGQALLDQIEEANAIARRYEARAVRRRALDLEDARDLKRMEEIDGWRCVGAVGAADFGERRGVAAGEARTRLGLGRAIKVLPSLEADVRTGRITVPSAALLGEVLSEPRLQRDGDDWVGWARSDSTRQFRRRVQKRKEEVALGTKVLIWIGLHVTEQALEDFHRARKIASRKAGQALTEGQTFRILAESYLDEHDEERVEPCKRRMPHTSLVDGRYVPAEVRREVRARNGRKCAVPYCDHEIFLDRAHIVPHRHGGSREADNIVEPCTQHHDLLDAGYLKLTGTAANPRFTDREGRDLSQRIVHGDNGAPKPPPPPEPPGTDPAPPPRDTGSSTNGPRRSMEGPDPP